MYFGMAFAIAKELAQSTTAIGVVCVAGAAISAGE